jgi:hypothetical protein
MLFGRPVRDAGRQSEILRRFLNQPIPTFNHLLKPGPSIE